MKSVSVEEAIARIEKDLKENEIAAEGVIRAAPTGPVTPIIPRDASEPMTPPTFRDSDQPLTLEELIVKLESETKASVYQEFCEKYTRITGETLINPAISGLLESMAYLRYAQGQHLLGFLKAHLQPDPTEERQCLNRLGEHLEVSREDGESNEAYRERIQHRTFPHFP